MDPTTPESVANQRDRTDSNVVNSNSNNFLLSIINKLAESLDQNNLNNVIGVELPEFKGLPSECIYNFLDRFNRNTSGLSDKNKIKALIRTLKGDAQLWARYQLSELDLNNKRWTEVEQQLKSRFGLPNRQLSNLQKAAKMKFDPDKRTLTSYVEQFAYYYKSTQKGLSDNFIITQLDINLEPKIKIQLSLLDDNWTEYQSLEELYQLIKRFEKLAPHHGSPSSNKPITEACLDAKLMEFTRAMSDKINSLISNKNRNDHNYQTTVAATTTKADKLGYPVKEVANNDQSLPKEENQRCNCTCKDHHNNQYRRKEFKYYRRQPYNRRGHYNNYGYRNYQDRNYGYEARPMRFPRNHDHSNNQAQQKDQQTKADETTDQKALNYQGSSKTAESMIQKL